VLAGEHGGRRGMRNVRFSVREWIKILDASRGPDGLAGQNERALSMLRVSNAERTRRF
jgi:hypothetical protein